MNNAIHTGGAYGLESLISGMQKKVSQTASNLSYKDMLASIQAQAESSAENVSETKSTADMTMEEYQTYIWRKIDSFPFSPTRPFDEETIKISDKCWNRMKSDPEYEKKMMDIIKDGRQYPDPFFGMGSSGAYSVLEFDGGEGCRSHTWSKNFGGSRSGARKQFERESEGGFWTIREKRAKQQAELDAKYYEKKEMYQNIGEHRAMLREMIARQQGLPRSSAEIPIMGVPAEFLLAGLMGGMEGI